MRAAIYARYSSAMQQESSAEDQITRCKECAESKGWTVVEEYVQKDSELTGRTVANRNGLAMLMEAAKRKPRPFDVIMIDNTARLGRNIADVLNQRDLLAFYGVSLFFVNGQLDTRAPGSRLMLTINAIRDEQYSADLSYQVSRGNSRGAGVSQVLQRALQVELHEVLLRPNPA